MTSVSYLFDENMPPAAGAAVRASEWDIAIIHVGRDEGAPSIGTLDPEILIYAEDNHYALVTFDKDSMVEHLVRHFNAGRHTWGVFIFPTGNYLSAGRIAEELIMVWLTSTADEWIDRTEYLPY